MSNPGPLSERLKTEIKIIDGHADTYRLFRNPLLFGKIVAELARLVRERRVDHIVSIEARGFIVGTAVAHEAGLGFVPIRRKGSLFPGEKEECKSGADYQGKHSILQIQREALRSGNRVVLVDDWIETGAQALAAEELIDRLGADLIAIVVVVDQAIEDARRQLPEIHGLVDGEDLNWG